MTRLGIIPAAGLATRIGGVAKELLPVSDKRTLIHRAVDYLEKIPVDRIVVITNQLKIQAHARALQDKQVAFALQHGQMDAWSAIVESFPYAGDWNYYLMPDTYQPANFEQDYQHEITFGIFTTAFPSRFGVLHNGQIVDKSTEFDGSWQDAWGTVVWSRRVVEFWKDNLANIETHTQAFNMAIKEFGYGIYNLPYYFDIATFEDYKKVLTHVFD